MTPKTKSCAFTGHRPRKFPWGYGETADACIRLKEALAKQIKKLAKAGYTDFLSGMAQGADTWAASAVLALRAKNPALRLHCVLPCRGQAAKWSDSARELYHDILSQADSVVYVSHDYHENCMLERNKYMVDHADCLLAVYNGEYHGGTAATVRYAQRLGRKTFILNPHTCLCLISRPF